MTISGTRAVRSASQPKIGSLTSRAAGQAAMTSPSVARSSPCSVEVDRQHGQQAAEADPDDELGDEQRQDRAPAVEPGPESRRIHRRRAYRPDSLPASGVLLGVHCRAATGNRTATRPDLYSPFSTTIHRCSRRMDVITAEGLVKVYKTPQERGPRARRRRPVRRRGHRPRPARAEWRGQDHGRPDPGHAAEARRWACHRRRLDVVEPGPGASAR